MYKLFILSVMLSCTHGNAQEKAIEKKTDIKKSIRESQLASKKDLVCGMPVYKYLKDTVLYEGKIYGFCGEACKIDFLKSPANFIH